MRAVTAAFVALGVAISLGLAGAAIAQPRRARPSTRGLGRSTTHSAGDALPSPGSLRGRFGADAAVRLTRSSDADERLRGIERAADTDTSGALALLERAGRASGPGALDPRLPDEGIARKDPRALLAVVRGLAQWTDNDGARAVLDEIVRAPVEAFATRPPGATSRDPADDESQGAARVTLARQEAAIALATSANPLALERLVTASRSGGPGQDAALLALAIAPPSDPATLGGVALTTPPILGLAARISDLRVLDPILGAVRASDPALRSAALLALSAAGDTRAVEVARAAAHDDDPRVRVAAASALAHLATPDASSAVEALVMDDATVTEGLRIAQSVQSEGIVKAAVARAVAASEAPVREAAVAALGRQISPSAVKALVAILRVPETHGIAAMPALQGDAACALARSPSSDALGAIETLVDAPVTRRLAARAYFVRRFLRGDRSALLDGALATLGASSDALDRAVGVQALVALGERSLASALADHDPRVRRAGAMGALAMPDFPTDATLLARAASDPDEATREVLARGWMTTDANVGHVSVTTSVLIERTTAGGPDAPLAAFALARRTEDEPSAQVDALLRSPDALLRAHTARGLGQSLSPSATGRLAAAYAWEGDAGVRRAILTALAAHVSGRDAEAARRVFDLADRLDPDAVARWIAANARVGTSIDRVYQVEPRAIAWLHIVPAETSPAPLGVTGLLATSDGRAVPIVFDDEGYALVPGVSPGEARLRLAPRLPAYSPSPP